ncbi:MAG: inositol 2-dehydrogenase [Deltaproteobacteria bacterium]|nr:inositol 2-dehydrogenase [Deltaproteobacteria bacterium]
MAAQLRIGIIGAGRIGTVHARTIVWRIPGARIVVIGDTHRAAAEKLAAELGVPRTTADPGEVLSAPDVDAVLICSSTDTHAELTGTAARAGKHVFCEKPLDLDLLRIDEVRRQVDTAGVKLQVGFNRRFDPDFAAIRAGIAAGAIGRPYLLRITSRDPGPPPLDYVRVSGGLFLDMTIHDFDMARFLLGEVEEVHTSAAVLVDPAIGEAGDVDTALVSLRFASGALGCIDNCRRATYGYDQRVEVLGSAGMLANRNHTSCAVEQHDGEGTHTPRLLDFFMTRYLASFEAELRSFVEAVVEDRTPPVTGLDGKLSVALGRAALRSLQERRPVRVAEVLGG